MGPIYTRAQRVRIVMTDVASHSTIQTQLLRAATLLKQTCLPTSLPAYILFAGERWFSMEKYGGGKGGLCLFGDEIWAALLKVVCQDLSSV